MEKFGVVIGTGVLGGLTGAVIAEFFPRLFQSGVAEAIGTAVNDVFSPYRNELAMKYGFGGLVIGLVLGVVIVLVSGNRARD